MKFGNLPRRLAISEVLGTTLMIAVTLVVGAAVWGYANTQAAVSEGTLGNNVAGTNNFLAEKFSVVDMNFPTSPSQCSSSQCVGFWLYNTGTVNLQLFQVRLVDSAGLINILYNYTKSGSTKDYIYDLKSSLSNKCKTLATTSLESVFLSTVNMKAQLGQAVTLTIPGTSSGCPSYGQFTSSGTAYTIIVTGLYTNSVTYYQVK